MSNQAMTWAYKQNIQPTGAKFVFVTLANYATQEGYCYASQERIAADTGQGVRTVRRILSDLEEAGWIVRERRSNKNGNRAADGFYLVGFGDNLPANVAASQAAKTATRQPANVTARDEEPTGHSVQAYRPNTTLPYKEVEPTIEPTIRVPPTSEHVRPVPKPARIDPIWDALVTLMGHQPATKSERGAWNDAAMQLRAVNATPDEVLRRGQRYRREWPKVKLTPSALARHWSEFAHGPPVDYEPPVWTGWKD